MASNVVASSALPANEKSLIGPTASGGLGPITSPFESKVVGL